MHNRLVLYYYTIHTYIHTHTLYMYLYTTEPKNSTWHVWNFNYTKQ